MTFHYDFLLKTLQSGNLDWIKLLHESYWYKRYKLTLAGVTAELEKEEKKLMGFSLTPQEILAMEERDVLATSLKGLVNAAKREAQKAWGAWENTHMGPRWAMIVKELWPEYCATRRNIAQLIQNLDSMADPTASVWPNLYSLGAMGFLEEPVKELRLTSLGTMATEINEGHPILMTQAYTQGLFKDLSAEMILTVVTAFGEEGGKEMPHMNTLDVPREVIQVLESIEQNAKENQRLEVKYSPKNSYWELNTTWVEPIWRWLQGVTLQNICSDYDCYEGNFLRLLSKVGNLLEELRSLATLAKDTDMLEKMRGVETHLMREMAVCDSLYLRL
jgi:hypothetical protein